MMREKRRGCRGRCEEGGEEVGEEVREDVRRWEGVQGKREEVGKV